MTTTLTEIPAVTPDPNSHWPDMARCDFCHEHFAYGIWAGEIEERKYYRTHDDYTVCGGCLEAGRMTE